jgi:DNA primase
MPGYVSSLVFMIDRTTIDKIFASADIVEVVSEFVKLKKSGQNFKGLSPFTDEKDPSFFVSPAKGIFKCFSSGKGGNAVTFLMEHEKLSYPEALRYLAKKYNIEIIEKEQTAEEIQQKNERESLMAVCDFAHKYFINNLTNTDEGKAVGVSYFHQRSYRDDIINKFQLGYARERKDAFTKTALDKGYKLDYLVKSGLTIQSEDFSFDRFHGRVMFPIHSLSGQVIGFGGRILKSDKKAAKYINSPESEIYHKSNVLYGLFFAKQSVIKNDKCYLVEGYTDVLSMHQAGVDNAVASSGTALTTQQIRLIKRFSKNITVIFDGDEAGIKASLRGIDLILEEDLNVKVLLLPDGEDPDSFARGKSAGQLLDFIKTHESDFISFKTRLLKKEAETDPVKRATLINDIVRSIAVIPGSITRTVYIRECSKILDVDERVLYTEINRIRRQRAEESYKRRGYEVSLPQEKVAPTRFTTREEERYVVEKDIIRLLLNFGNNNISVLNKQTGKEQDMTVAQHIIFEIGADELEFTHPVYKNIYDEIKQHISDNDPVVEKYFIHHPNETISRIAVDLLTSAYDLSKIWAKHDNYVETEDMKLKEIVPEAVNAFKNKKVLDMIKETQKKLKDAQENNDADSISLLQQKFILLNDLKKKLSRDLGYRIIV